MPTVTVARDRLFDALGRVYTDEEFDELCFEFGIELDEVCQESTALGGRAKTGTSGETLGEDDTVEWVYKIEVGANRYDLLCLEGIAQALRVFTGKQASAPDYRLSHVEPALEMHVTPATSPLRPFVVSAVLRGVDLTSERYQSLIDLQDKLHQNVCRRRTLVAIGTHDLDTLQGPFQYDARDPQEIRFVPLALDRDFAASELMVHYETDNQMKRYLPIIRDSPVYPVITDSKGTVLSLPPIINGDHSKITLQTKNILIECTATDLTKANIVLNTLIAMYSGYCSEPHTVEPVKIVYPDGSKVTPDLEKPQLRCTNGIINKGVGIELGSQETAALLRKMQLEAEVLEGDDIIVTAPITRTDVIHPCDVVEDVAVAYGFNNVEERVPHCGTEGQPYPINQLADMVRREGFSVKGYTEVLTWVTVSHEENFDWMQRPDDGKQAVRISNPKALEFQECRVALLPGILKTLRENRGAKLPLRLFEVGDVIVLDSEAEVGARNRRHMAAVYASTSAGFEIIKDLLDHLMVVLGHPANGEGDRRVYLDADGCNDDAFFPGRRATVMVGGSAAGTIGWVHPHVLGNYSVDFPCSAVELDLEMFL